MSQMAAVVALGCMFVLFFDGLPIKLVAYGCVGYGLLAYYFLDPILLGASADVVTKTLQKLAIVCGAVFGGALHGMISGRELIEGEGLIHEDQYVAVIHRKLRMRWFWSSAVGILCLIVASLINEQKNVVGVWHFAKPILEFASEYAIASGAGFFIESRAEILENLKKSGLQA